MSVQNISEDALRAELKKRLIDGSITKDQARQAVLEFKKAQTPEGGLVDALWEPVEAIVGGLAGQVASGYAGMFKLATGQGLESAAETVTSIQEDVAEATKPETKRGQFELESIGDLVELGIDAVQVPISGVAGIAELLSGQGLDQAAKTIEDINTKGVGYTAGERAYEITGSPVFATVASMTPELVGAAIPIAGKIKKMDKFSKHTAIQLKNNAAAPEVARKVLAISDEIKSGNMPSTEVLNKFDDLAAGASESVKESLKGVIDDIMSGIDKKSITNQLDDIAAAAAKPVGDKDLARYVAKGATDIKGDTLAKQAIAQGFDEGVIATVKAGTKTDRSKLRAMVDTMEKAKKDALFAMDNRPSDIAGNSLLERIKYIKKVNMDSGAELGKVANSLKGKSIDFSPAVRNFIDRLDDLGVRIGNDLKPVFRGSDIEGVTAAENIIKKVVARMSSGKAPDAYDLHRMKRFLDENLTYGKVGEGLSGRTETILKKLRRDIDRTLDDAFPEYDKVNSTYAETVDALDSMQRSMGSKIDIFGDNADKAIGTSLRRLMGNTQGRIQLSNAVDELERLSMKYGAEFDDSIKIQMQFANELDSVFRPAARTGFQGQVGEGVRQGIEAATGQKTGLGILSEAAEKLANKVRGVSDEKALETIKKLLEREQ